MAIGSAALACGDKQMLLLFPAADLLPLFDGMVQPPGDHWHVYLYEKDGAVHVYQPGKGERRDVSRHLIPAEKGVGGVPPSP